MYLIGERINGMFCDIKEAIEKKDETSIKHWVEKQIECGAHALDVSTGPAEQNADTMAWLVEAVRKYTEVPLSIDTTNFEAMEAGLELAGEGKGIINSASAEKQRLLKAIELAKKYSSKIIALTMDEAGVPKDASKRLELAAQIITETTEAEIPPQDLFIDTVVLPVNVAQDHVPQVLEAIPQIKMLSDPPVRTILGISNVSQKCNLRPLINRVFLVMTASSGLDSAILNVCDKELIDSLITAEVLLNKHIYCDNFLEASKK